MSEITRDDLLHLLSYHRSCMSSSQQDLRIKLWLQNLVREAPPSKIPDAFVTDEIGKIYNQSGKWVEWFKGKWVIVRNPDRRAARERYGL